MLELEKYAENLVPSIFLSSFWTVLTFVIFPRIWKFGPKRLRKWYEKEDWEKKLDWDARATATLHAALIFLICFVAIITDTDFVGSNIYSTSPIASVGLQLSNGYFLSDLIICYKLRKYYGNQTIAFYFHHFISLGGILQTLKGGSAMWFTCLRLWTELSTPFVNLSFMFELFDLQGTSLYRRNKHIAYWSFILCRPVLMPFFWYATYEHLKSGIFWEIEKPTQFVWLIFGGLLDTLNLVWTRSLTIEYKNWLAEPKNKSHRKKFNSEDRKLG